MKRTPMFAALVAMLISGAGIVRAAGFTYHGSLQDAGKPANGTYDIELTLYSAQTGGSVIGGPLTMYAVPVQGGSFSTEADFGPLAKAFSQAYVGVKVRGAGKGDFATLDTRAAVTVNAATGCPGSWDLLGNAGNPSGSFLGTTDNVPLQFKTNGVQAALTFVTADGPVPIWLGGLFNEYGGQGAFVGGGGGTSSSDTTNANSAGTFGVVGGGQANAAGSFSLSYAAIAGGKSNTASANYAFIGGGLGNTASGQYAAIGGGILNQAIGTGSAVPGGTGNLASGKYSLAAGVGASAGDNSFVWSDGYGATTFASSAANQFDIKATGGVAINGTPVDNGTELSIYPNSTSGNYSNLFMGSNGKGGIQLSTNPPSTTTSNDASLTIDQYDGTNRARKLIVNTDGLSINGTNGVDTTAHPALSVMSTSSSATQVATDFIPGNGSNGYFEMLASTFPIGSDLNEELMFSAVDTQQGSRQMMSITRYDAGAAIVQTYGELDVGTNSEAHDLYVTGNAYKPGGGTWTATSDRRIKQDIAPIHDALDTVMKLRPVNFRYTPEYRAMAGGLADRPYAGFIAQEYAEVFPTDVVSTRDHVPGAAKNDPTILALDPNPALITTVAAVQELAVENSELHKQVDALEARLSKLEAGKGH